MKICSYIEDRISFTTQFKIFYCFHAFIDKLQLYIEVNNYITSKARNSYARYVKQNEDGMDKNILHCCYGEYVTTNKQA